MKKLLILLLCLFTTDSFGSGIASNSTYAPCTNNTLETYSGNSNLAADWQPNTINLSWYNGDTKLTVQSSAQSCVYDGTLTIPSTQPTRTGYTFAGWEVRLPGAYTELEYLESSGTQYIDTGLTVNGNTEVSVDLQLLETPYSRYIFGSYTYDAPTRNYFLWITGNSDYAKYQYGWHSGYANFSTPDTNRHLFRIYNDGYWAYLDIDGVNVGRLKNVDSMPESHHTFILFRGYETKDGNDRIYTGISQKMYKVVIKQNRNIIMNLIPARRNSDNVLGMYDTVTRTFFTNAGTGTFIAGPAVTE